MKSPKRQWRDVNGVVHEVYGDDRLHYDKRTRLKCWGETPTLWRSTRDAPTCLACITYVPTVIRIN